MVILKKALTTKRVRKVRVNWVSRLSNHFVGGTKICFGLPISRMI